MIMTIDRRSFTAGLVGAAIATAGARPARAQAGELNVFGHRVHQTAATTGPGGDATAAWRTATGGTANWITLGDVAAIHERLLREATLPETSFDVAYLLNGRAIPRNLRLFEPLNAFLQSAPIEDFEDFPRGLTGALEVDGTLRGIPVRHATNAMIYNEAIFRERGVDPNFRSAEEMIEAAKRLTFRRADGTQVVGLAFTPVFASNFLSIARAFGGDYMSEDRRITAAEPGMVRALAALADLFRSGAMPRNFATLNNEELVTAVQQGRIAMHVNPYARLVALNDPQRTSTPGAIKPFLPPVASDLAGRATYAPTVEFWSLVIPRNSRNKDRAWAFVRALSSRQATLASALNGNGPTRASTYGEARLREMLPHAGAEAEALRRSRVHLPAFDEQARAHDIFIEESQAAVLGMKTPEVAMQSAARRVAPLVQPG